jgi:RNA polymerase sigma factor FliA
VVENVDEMWREYSTHPTPELKAKLAEHYSNLAYKISYSFAYKKPNVLDFEDILQEARLGLLDAIDKFDYSRGFQFSTYAQQRIRGAIIDGINIMDWTPRKAKKEIRMVIAGMEKHGEKNYEKIAEELNMTVDEVKKIVKSMEKTYILPMDYEALSFHSPFDDVERKELETNIKHIIDTVLTEMEAEFVKLYFFWGYNFNEVAELLNLSKKEMKTLRANVYDKLREGLKTFRTEG